MKPKMKLFVVIWLLGRHAGTSMNSSAVDLRPILSVAQAKHEYETEESSVQPVPQSSKSVLHLSLIHISEPTRPY